MKLSNVFVVATLVLVCSGGAGIIANAQGIDESFLQGLHWRSIGPFRGGRTRAVAGVPSQPNVFFAAQVNGGLWKTTDYGRTWQPIFDDQPTGSIGAIAVAPSNPDIIYVGSGEGLRRPDLSVGDGIYKSTDAGRSWSHLGLRDGQQIAKIAVDPHDPTRLFVAVAGHPYGPNEERGIFRSTDGGQTFTKVLYKDENVGGSDVEIDPVNPGNVYAGLWEEREGPWENGTWRGTGGGVFKSSDGGSTWRQLTKGLPDGIVQANLSVSASAPTRLISSVATATGVKLYRSDDAGETWSVLTTDPRPALRIGGGDLPVPRIDPKNPDVIYSASIVCWRSTDGGKTWTGIRGAPGGDDYQNVWINPNNSDIVLLGSDQGAIITVNGGRTWSSWYNQPTAQLYHVGVDNAFPYHVCSGQQESGSACIASRGNDGEITFRDWRPVAAEEYGYVTPDPLNPEIVYGGKLTRFNYRTTQAQVILPKNFRSSDFRMVRTEPVVFSPVDPHVLYFAANTLWTTKDGGQSWRQISPDLSRKTYDVPASVGKYRSTPEAAPKQRGVIYAVAPSPLDINRIWAGTDDGLIHLTTDGGANWTNVTPPQLSAWQKVSVIEASHFDVQTAYAAINTLRLDDLRPHILRTSDSGKTWAEITSGIPANENVNVVREDPQRKGLLFAGTERAAYASFDDGGNWQSLRLNLPATSVRDLVIKNDDLIAATHGRGFWILDNITPLRQLDSAITSSQFFLFRPQTAVRVRWNTNSDTPLPPDVPAGENPPDGAAVDYYLKGSAAGPVTLEFRDSRGEIVRRYSSADKMPEADPMLDIPEYWVRPSQALSSVPGMHRFVWDMHYAPITGLKPDYPIAAVYRNTVPASTSPWVLPGTYSVVLTANGVHYIQPLEIKIDPRVTTSGMGLSRQFELSRQLYALWPSLAAINKRVMNLSTTLTGIQARTQKPATASQIEALSKQLKELIGAESVAPGELPVLGALTRLQLLFRVLQDTDEEPTEETAADTAAVVRESQALINTWRNIEAKDVPALDRLLRSTGAAGIETKEPGDH